VIFENEKIPRGSVLKVSETMSWMHSVAYHAIDDGPIFHWDLFIKARETFQKSFKKFPIDGAQKQLGGGILN
jgi:hypothetical protein